MKLAGLECGFLFCENTGQDLGCSCVPVLASANTGHQLGTKYRATHAASI